MVAKLDLENAYDRIDSGFLEQVLILVGFVDHLVKLIMFCCSSTLLSVLRNGVKLDPFVLERGIRQGVRPIC